MELIVELEHMAGNATAFLEDNEPSLGEIRLWKNLFGYSDDQAVNAIKEQRQDITRARVSDELWEEIKSEKEAEGFTRDSYEHFIRSRCMFKRPSPDRTFSSSNMYLVTLEDPLDTPEKIQYIAGLSAPPELRLAINDNDEPTRLCELDCRQIQSLTSKLPTIHAGFEPKCVAIPRSAPKDLSPNSPYPTLGVDATMPQNLPETNGVTFQPSQDQYPVWYFFYGTLGDPERLSRLFGLPDGSPLTPILHPARVAGGSIKLWENKYKALVDGPSNATVEGVAYKVRTKESEDVLRAYETAKYEVVRCEIHFLHGGPKVRGCTFRFADSES